MLSTNPYCPPDEPWEGKQTESNENEGNKGEWYTIQKRDKMLPGKK